MQPQDQIPRLATPEAMGVTARTPVVIAIHGSASSGRQWSALAATLEGRARVVAPDLPGYGKAVDNGADRLAFLRGAIPSARGRVHLVAHSFGCAIVLKLAHACPTRVASVTLYDPITVQTDASGAHRLPGTLDRIWRTHAAAPATELMRLFFNFWSSGDRWSDLEPEQQARLIRHHPGLCRDMAEITRGDWSIPQPRYDGPLAIFCGQRSPEVILRMAHEIAGAHRGASLTFLPGLGHFAPLTDPEAVNPYIARRLPMPRAFPCPRRKPPDAARPPKRRPR